MTYVVLVNAQDQYSIWPLGMELPAGWREAGVIGTRDECLDHIATAWAELPVASSYGRRARAPRR
jgi:MbtH protein